MFKLSDEEYKYSGKFKSLDEITFVPQLKDWVIICDDFKEEAFVYNGVAWIRSTEFCQKILHKTERTSFGHLLEPLSASYREIKAQLLKDGIYRTMDSALDKLAYDECTPKEAIDKLIYIYEIYEEEVDGYESENRK